MANIVTLATETAENTEALKQELINALISKGVTPPDGAELNELITLVNDIDNEPGEFIPGNYYTKEELDLRFKAIEGDYVSDSELLSKGYLTTNDLNAALKSKKFITEDNIPAASAKIGSFFWHFGNNPPQGAYILNGQTIPFALGDNPVNSEFYQWVKTEGRLLSEAEYSAELQTYGVCGGFVLDESAMFIRLPHLLGAFIEAKNSVGSVTGAGLPDIDLALRTDGKAMNSYYSEFLNEYGTDDYGGGLRATSSGSDEPMAVMSSAEPKYTAGTLVKSDKYGKSDTVQPLSIGALPCIQVFNQAAKLEVTDGDQLALDLQNKMDKGFGNADYSDEFRSRVIGFNTPDYSKTETIKSVNDKGDFDEHTYTAPEDGVLNASLVSHYNREAFVYIDATLVCYAKCGSSGYVFGCGGQFTVPKGAKIRWKNGYYNVLTSFVSFTPFKKG